MTDEELNEIIDNLRTIGSDVAAVEAKRSRQGLPKSVRESLSSFSNTVGGVIILGLDEADNFAAVGVANPTKLSSDTASLCSDEMEPPLRPLIGIHRFEDSLLVVVEVPEVDRTQKPCFYKGSGINQGSYIRVGDGDRRLTSYEVQVMLSSRGQPRDDEQATDADVNELDGEQVDRFVRRLKATRSFAFGELDTEQILRRSKVLVRDEVGSEKVSLAGLLALGDYPQQYFPQLMLTFIHYARDDGSESDSGVRLVDNAALEGSIPRMVDEGLRVLRRNMSRRAVVSGAGRTDVWEYPETALREAISNALVHRDLSPAAMGTQVQIEMYPSRLVVRNPGGLYGPVTVEDLGEEGICSSRNATLLKLLEDVYIPGEQRTVCENRGTGIRSMIASLRSARMSPPAFDDRVSSFRVTFPNHSLLNDETIGWIRSLAEEGLTESQCVALAVLREGQILDNTMYRSLTGVDSRIATSELGDLVGRELAEQSGSRRWARYTLGERVSTGVLVADSAGPPGRGDRRDLIVDAFRHEGETLSRVEISGRTGMSTATTRRWLSIMRDEGLLEIVDGAAPQSPRTRYRLAGHTFDPLQERFTFES